MQLAYVLIKLTLIYDAGGYKIVHSCGSSEITHMAHSCGNSKVMHSSYVCAHYYQVYFQIPYTSGDCGIYIFVQSCRHGGEVFHLA